MSGRWRSRYWTADDSGTQQQPVPPHYRYGRTVTYDHLRGDNNQEPSYDESDGWSSKEARYSSRDRGNDSEERYRNYGQEFRQREFRSHRQQHPNHPQPQRWQPDERREWQRGQSLPQTSLSHCQGRKIIKSDPALSTSGITMSLDRQGNHVIPAASTSREHLESSTTKYGATPDSIPSNSQATAKKPFAWNKPDSSVTNQSVPAPADPDTTNAKVIAKKPFAWAKPDPSPSQSVASAATISSSVSAYSQITSASSTEALGSNSKLLTKKTFAWGVTSGTSCQAGNSQPTTNTTHWTPKPLSTDSSSVFPPLHEKRTQPSESGREILPSSTSLPPTSSWGTRQNESLPVIPGISNEIQQKAKAEEFPSLFTASTIPRTQPGLRNTPQIVNSTTDKQQAKRKTPSKNCAPQASLASFLSKQAVAARGKVPNDANPSASASKKNGIASANVGNKRSAPSSATVKASEDGKGGIQFASGSTKKGPQRLIDTSTPRKKKLTSLKKKVLKERLRVWKERNGIVDGNDDDKVSQNEQPCTKRLKTDDSQRANVALREEAKEPKPTTLLVGNYIRPEDNLIDDDEYDEIISDLIHLAGRVGKVLSVFVPRPQECVSDEAKDGNDAIDHTGLAFVRFASYYDVCAANEILEGMVVGGQKIRTSILSSKEQIQLSDCIEIDERLWRIQVLRVARERQSSMNVGDDEQNSKISTTNNMASIATIVFHNILCDDDYEDEEALHESIEDLKAMAREYGQVVGSRWETMGENQGNVYITFALRSSAYSALTQLDGLVVGGSKIVVSLDGDLPQEHQHSTEVVILSNILNDDDLKDEDCLSESINDIRQLAGQYGIIGNIHAEATGEQKGNVVISYIEGRQVAQQAAQQLDGMVFGGHPLSASLSSRNISDTDSSPLKDESKCDPALPVMLSGGKRISEQFAACKRVPKVPNAGTPRSYASKIADERAVPLLVEMLGELMRLQERSKDDKNARARRRLVMGLREVARGIRAHKVKMVVMANNLDEYGAIDSKLQEILDMATADELPILYELNKRKLGKALGKSIKVAVVGIQNADGAHDQFKKLKKMLGKA